MPAILVDSARVAMAEAIMSRTLHLAWGSGSPSWDATPVPNSTSETALVAEVGRRAVASAQYCYEDPSGSIQVPTGTFSPSLTSTNSIYLRFNFDFSDSPTATIRELGVFVGTVTNPSLPPGQMYFLPSDIVSPGRLLVAERVTAFTRSANVRQAFEFVITF